MFGYAMKPTFSNLVYHFLQDIKYMKFQSKKKGNLNLPTSLTMSMSMESKRKL
jgi:hypothetical protein